MAAFKKNHFYGNLLEQGFFQNRKFPFFFFFFKRYQRIWRRWRMWQAVERIYLTQCLPYSGAYLVTLRSKSLSEYTFLLVVASTAIFFYQRLVLRERAVVVIFIFSWFMFSSLRIILLKSKTHVTKLA